MKRYEDIKARARKADPELQLLLGEAELGRALAELKLQALKSQTQTVTGAVLGGDSIMFRVAVFEKGAMTDREALTILAQGKTFDEKVIILKDDSPLLKIWEKTPKDDEE